MKIVQMLISKIYTNKPPKVYDMVVGRMAIKTITPPAGSDEEPQIVLMVQYPEGMHQVIKLTPASAEALEKELSKSLGVASLATNL